MEDNNEDPKEWREAGDEAGIFKTLKSKQQAIFFLKFRNLIQYVIILTALTISVYLDLLFIQIERVHFYLL